MYVKWKIYKFWNLYGALMSQDFKEQLNALKSKFNAKNDKELSEKLNISYSAIDAWKRRKTIPQKYVKFIFQESSDNNAKQELIFLINKLDETQINHYLNLIKKEIL